MSLVPEELDGSADSVEVAHDRVRGAILRGELTPGEELSQVEIARRLGVSRTPLREALRMLQREGLIEAERHRRIRVAPFSLDELEQLYAMRVILEAFCIRETVPRLTATQLDELDELLVTMDELAARNDVEGWEAPHHRFHLALGQHARFGQEAFCGQLAGETRVLQDLLDALPIEARQLGGLGLRLGLEAFPQGPQPG